LLVVSAAAATEDLWKELGNVLTEAFAFIPLSYCWVASSLDKTLAFELCAVILEVSLIRYW
jgi:hypothetical protein